MATLDSEIAQGIQSRDARRHRSASELLKRIMARGKKKYSEQDLKRSADILAMLTGFATYDTLAKAGHSQEEITVIIRRLVHFAAA